MTKLAAHLQACEQKKFCNSRVKGDVALRRHLFKDFSHRTHTQGGEHNKHHRKNQEQAKEDFGYAGRARGDTAKAERTCNK